jgi:hypothetical protein
MLELARGGIPFCPAIAIKLHDGQITGTLVVGSSMDLVSKLQTRGPLQAQWARVPSCRSECDAALPWAAWES